MNIRRALGVLALATVCLHGTNALAHDAAAPGHGRIVVGFVDPEQFTDLGDRFGPDARLRAYYAELLRKHLELRLGARVSAGQVFAVVFTDIDRAGSPGWARGGRWSSVRVVRDATPPRLDLRFRWIDAAGAVIGEGARRLRNPAFLWGGTLYRDDPLRYEKTLLDDWLDEEFPVVRGSR